MSGPSTSTILTITGVTIIGGFLAYATYFDYKRRNDATFRKQLRKEKKRVREVALKDEEEEKERMASMDGIPKEIIQAMYEQACKVPMPSSPEERETYFMGLISQADQLITMGPNHYMDAAMLFYHALRVYPSPLDMISLYKQQLPGPVMAVVVQLYNLDMLDRIHGYYDTFPPESMNVTIKQKDSRTGEDPLRVHSLIATRDFKAGEEVYVEAPLVATLDTDIQLRGTHCTQCLRPVEQGLAIRVESDPLNAVYCSKKCQVQSKIQNHNALFGREIHLADELDAELFSKIKPEDRVQAQTDFIGQWSSTSSSSLMLVARLCILQVVAEIAKQLKSAKSLQTDLPEIATDRDRSVYDHFERLRYFEPTIPDGESSALRNLLVQTFPDLADTCTDHRYSLFKGKMAYNAIGVCFGGGRDDRPKPATLAETEYTRTPYGTAKQIGCGLYLVSSYLAHSCSPSVRPSFSNGTSELHLVATRDIQKGDELTMAYVDVSQKADESVDVARRRRRSELAKGWKFACQCSRCEEESKTLEGSGDDEYLNLGGGAKLEPIPMKPGSEDQAPDQEVIG